MLHQAEGRKQQHKELASGEIEIYTGYITTNDDGNIGDGCVDECTYYADDIINYAQDVLNSYEDLCEKEKTVSTELSKIFAYSVEIERLGRRK